MVLPSCQPNQTKMLMIKGPKVPSFHKQNKSEKGKQSKLKSLLMLITVDRWHLMTKEPIESKQKKRKKISWLAMLQSISYFHSFISSYYC
ncbi:hypothetical protein DERF_010222 [Dermatophagoides farinae]|uniref:Uncharacterized protein n=1 Tax=Dermatophagoides farinae TaxID=6954 RepID=A0A922L4T4_DERFA|nr:hypothetical protein DERF_010222 [Dermatophagoides farinae]